MLKSNWTKMNITLNILLNSWIKMLCSQWLFKAWDPWTLKILWFLPFRRSARHLLHPPSAANFCWDSLSSVLSVLYTSDSMMLLRWPFISSLNSRDLVSPGALQAICYEGLFIIQGKYSVIINFSCLLWFWGRLELGWPLRSVSLKTYQIIVYLGFSA